jgi:hypothetical protein
MVLAVGLHLPEPHVDDTAGDSAVAGTESPWIKVDGLDHLCGDHAGESAKVVEVGHKAAVHEHLGPVGTRATGDHHARHGGRARHPWHGLDRLDRVAAGARHQCQLSALQRAPSDLAILTFPAHHDLGDIRGRVQTVHN